jgi:hypothetical protein
VTRYGSCRGKSFVGSCISEEGNRLSMVTTTVFAREHAPRGELLWLQSKQWSMARPDGTERSDEQVVRRSHS